MIFLYWHIDIYQTEASFRRFSQIFADKYSLHNHLLHFINISFFQVLDFFSWLSEETTINDQIIKQYFRINDVKKKNKDKKQYTHLNKNKHKKKEKQQNDYKKYNKLKMLLFTLR